MLELESKPDAEDALSRMEAWWSGENDERAILTIGIDSPTPEPRIYATHRDRWLDFDYRIERAVQETSVRPTIAETFPVFEPNLGPDILSTIYGLDLTFEDSTSWGSPVIESLDRFFELAPDFCAELWQAMERLQRMAIEAGKGRWITLFTDLHPNIDILSALIGPQNLCLAIADEPKIVAEAVERLAPVCAEAYRRQLNPLLEAGLPIGCWMQAFSRSTTYVAQCDFSALIGPAFFRDSVFPAIRTEMAEAERNIYHLDGPDALRHLDLLLEAQEIDAVQWVYGAGNGPARRWLPVYRRIRDAGKAIRVECEDVEDIRFLNDELGPRGVWYAANFSAPDLPSAERILASLSPAPLQRSLRPGYLSE